MENDTTFLVAAVVGGKRNGCVFRCSARFQSILRPAKPGSGPADRCRRSKVSGCGGVYENSAAPSRHASAVATSLCDVCPDVGGRHLGELPASARRMLYIFIYKRAAATFRR